MIIQEWIKVLIPGMNLVNVMEDIDNSKYENSFMIWTGGGQPSLLGIDDCSPEKNRLGCTIDTVNEHSFDYLIIILDCDDQDPKQIKEEVNRRIESYKNKLNDGCTCKIFVQNKCFETWLLGYRELIYNLNDQSEYYDVFVDKYLDHYNIINQDPELLEKPEYTEISTISKYHVEYLKYYFLATCGLTYKKGKKPKTSKIPPIVFTTEYINSLKNRIKETKHLESLKEFFEFINEVNLILKEA